MDTIEGMERVDASKMLNEIIREQKYQKIELVLQDGNIVAVRRKVKHKIGKLK